MPTNLKIHGYDVTIISETGGINNHVLYEVMPQSKDLDLEIKNILSLRFRMEIELATGAYVTAMNYWFVMPVENYKNSYRSLADKETAENTETQNKVTIMLSLDLTDFGTMLGTFGIARPKLSKLTYNDASPLVQGGVRRHLLSIDKYSEMDDSQPIYVSYVSVIDSYRFLEMEVIDFVVDWVVNEIEQTLRSAFGKGKIQKEMQYDHHVRFTGNGQFIIISVPSGVKDCYVMIANKDLLFCENGIIDNPHKNHLFGLYVTHMLSSTNVLYRLADMELTDIGNKRSLSDIPTVSIKPTYCRMALVDYYTDVKRYDDGIHTFVFILVDNHEDGIEIYELDKEEFQLRVFGLPKKIVKCKMRAFQHYYDNYKMSFLGKPVNGESRDIIYQDLNQVYITIDGGN